MDYSPSQVSLAGISPAMKWTGIFYSRLRQPNISLIAETAIVTIAAILAVRAFSEILAPGVVCFAVPGILAAAAFVPTAIRKRKFAQIGLSAKQLHFTLPAVWWTCAAVFPFVFLGMWVLKTCGVTLLTQPVFPPKLEWAGWLFYQFMYVAVAEEIFFRGYVQSNILMLMNAVIEKKYWLQQWLSIVLSAACFAVAHILVQGQMISGLTFFPGLILGWLFIRTKTLLGPILFHGLANTCYFVMAGILA